jgi:ATP-dependent DNA helicase RecG
LTALLTLWAALHRPLVLAARDNFRLLDEDPTLGRRLCDAAQALAAAWPADADAARLGEYADRLRELEAEDRGGRARLVALGLRLCAEARPPEGEPSAVAEPPAEEGADLPPWAAPLTVLHGVGPVVARRLAARGLLTVEDLLYFLPREYQDRRDVRELTELVEGERATTRGVVLRATQRRARGRRMVELALGTAVGGKVLLRCVWFKAFPGLVERFARGRWVLASGTVRRYKDELQIVHPDVVVEPDEDGEPDAPLGQGIRRRYLEVEGVAPRIVERLCTQACQRFADTVPDGVPERVARAEGLRSQGGALRFVHLEGVDPDAAELARLRGGEHEAQARLVFDELFSLQLAVARRRGGWSRRQAFRCALSDGDAARLRGCFPFALTAAQHRVTGEILADMGRPTPMHRLLQGDVGSGKTAVAFTAAWAAMSSGLQAAIMAPTEILARQHFGLMETWCRALDRRAALLTAATPRAARESLLALADAGEIHLLVGTHALLARRVSLPNLGLAVVDEQHRFGVVQRVRLRDRDQEQPLPHLLVMTATPIPRTLALSVYGDLDLSLLDEKPPGRRPPQTRLFVGKQRSRAYALVEQQLERGQQVFVVCPLVEESDKVQAADAVSTAAQLQRRLASHRVGIVHGRMAPRERGQVMEAFRRRELDLLVATTVIEVGIDVPDANVIVIEHADRFGLAQLHQLRGRVGRGEADSFCLLLSEARSDTPAGERLAAMCRSHDGFELAEVDLRLRGPGELFGTRQSGLPRLRFADLRRHLELLARAQRAAAAVIAEDAELTLPEHDAAREVMLRRWEEVPLVGAEAG